MPIPDFALMQLGSGVAGRLVTATVTFALALFLTSFDPSVAAAELRAPQPIDAATGEDAEPLGATVGERGAWAAFTQPTGGLNRLYVAHAQDAVFEPPVLADRGNPVEFAGLAGNPEGDGVLFFIEEINNNGVIFARRLANGQLGAIQQVSPDGEDASFGNPMFPYDRETPFAVNGNGAAVLCYEVGMDSFAATLPAGSETWSVTEFPDGCFEPGIDAAGNVVALGTDANGDLVATRLVGGQLSTDLVEADAMDQTTLAVGSSGIALATGRDNTFHVFARRKLDIAGDGPWERVGGNVEEGLIQGANSSPEDPFAVLDAEGDGLLLFRDNRMFDAANDPADNPLAYYRVLSAGGLGGGDVLGATSSRPRLAGGAEGTVFTTFASYDFESALLREFTGGIPAAETALASGLEPYLYPNIAGFAASANGNLLALVETATAPRRVYAVFDFTPPAGGVGLDVEAKRKRSLRKRVKAKARCVEQCELLAKAKLKVVTPVGDGKKRKRNFTVRDRRISLDPGETEKVVFRITRKGLKKAENALERGGKAVLKAKVRAENEAAGAVERERLKIRLR